MKISLIASLITTSFMAASEVKRTISVEPYRTVLFHGKINGVYVTTIHVDGVEVSRSVEQVPYKFNCGGFKKLFCCGRYK
jgi:hypothetical protein